MPLTRKPITSTGGGYNRRNFADQVLNDCPQIFYRFNEGSGNTMIDRSGFEMNGSYSRVTWSNEDLTKTGDSSVTNVKGQFFHPYTSRLEWSAELLVQLPTPPAKGWLFGFGSYGGLGFGIGNGTYDNPGNVITGIAPGINWLNTGAYYSGGKHHLGISVDVENNIRLFYDGQCVYKTNIYYTVQNDLAFFNGDPGGYGENNSVIYDEFAFYPCLLANSRFYAHWKAAQLGI